MSVSRVSAKRGDACSPVTRAEVSILSPLRYPGSKRRLAGYVKRALEINGLGPGLFVEPFAGGASVALQLLMDGAVQNIGLADRDPLIAAFWKCAFFDTDWLVEQIDHVEVTIDQWQWFRAATPSDTRGRALKCLFLNRTNFSGIMSLTAGPIGGRHQRSIYKIDCRFPRETLKRRIRQAQSLAHKVAFVWNLSWRRTLSLVGEMQEKGSLSRDIFYYFDPPFFDKADSLYVHWFDARQHIDFRDEAVRIQDPWIISYDSVPRVVELYLRGSSNGTKVQSLYSAGVGGLRRSEEAIITNLEALPQETRLWRTREEWEKSGKSRTKDQYDAEQH